VNGVDIELPATLRELVDRWVLNERDRGLPPGLFHAGDTGQFADATYVGRTFAGRIDGGWGNPFRARRDGTHEAIVEHHRWLTGPATAAVALRRRLAAGELTAVHLSCWCHPQPCHAWTLCGLANGAGDDVATWIAALAGD
jgi:hypothetical protein